MLQHYLPLEDVNKLPNPTDLRALNPSQYRFCLDEREVIPNKQYYSTNQKLVGPPNPKMSMRTPVVAPCYAFDFWSNPYVVSPYINNKTNTELIQSGYIPLNNNKAINNCSPYMDNVSKNNDCLLSLNNNRNGIPCTSINMNNASVEPFSYNTESCVPQGHMVQYQDEHQQYAQQHPNIPTIWINENGTKGDLIPFNGYHPEQLLDHNIPSNIPAGQCSQDNAFNEYNKSLFTNIIQPGLYAETEMVQPIQSNMGITFTQQLPPLVRHNNEDGSTTYINRDPRIIYPQVKLEKPPATPTPDNVYDPRTQGYGTSYRTYIDEMSGQPRFYYDDVNAIRKPNYIVRSNIDHWAQQYGPLKDKEPTCTIAMAQKRFSDDAISFREDIQQQYMNKYNTQIGWQRRMAPIRQNY